MKKVFFVGAIMCMAAVAFVACKKNEPAYAGGSCLCYAAELPDVKTETPNPYESCEALAAYMTQQSQGLTEWICAPENE